MKKFKIKKFNTHDEVFDWSIMELKSVENSELYEVFDEEFSDTFYARGVTIKEVVAKYRDYMRGGRLYFEINRDKILQLWQTENREVRKLTS